MSQKILTPKAVPEEQAEKWLEGIGDVDGSVLASGIRHLELMESYRFAIKRVWISLFLVVGLLGGVFGYLLIGYHVFWSLAAVVLYGALEGLRAFRLLIEAKTAEAEALVVQRNACGTLKMVMGPDDLRPAKIDPKTGEVVPA